MDRDHAIQIAMGMKAHTGPIQTDGPGRTDNVDMHVAANSFVIPADIVSSLGQGHTEAGYKALDHILGPHTTHPGNPKVPIVAAGGEYVCSPEQVARVGDGDVKRGHSILDAFIRHQRKKTVEELSKLPGPARK